VTHSAPAVARPDPAAADTIAALATAPGRGAVALVRVSGPAAFAVAGRVLRPAAGAWPPPARRLVRAAACDPDGGRLLDHVLVAAFPGPRSYTGDDLVEVSTHGGLAAPAAVLAALVAAGARPAVPGEFTRRAVLNGKLDLAQAEAVGDLVDARTDAMRAAALATLDGGLSRRVAALRDRVLDVEALVAYDVDFPEEDDGPVSRERVLAAARTASDAVDGLLATAPAGAIARDGAVVVLAGPPNAGKSSLFNALAGEARALVTEVPGTTRDALEVLIEAPPAAGRGSWPLRLVDTAGLRDTDDRVERLGVELSERWLRRAHLAFACGETPADVAATRVRVAALTDAPVLGVWTKADLRAPPGGTAAPPAAAAGHPHEVSAESGYGCRALVEAAVRAVAARYGAPDPELPLVTRARHRRALEEGRGELTAFVEAWSTGTLPATVAAVHLRAAAHALDAVIGGVDTEDVLDRVFGSFCIGK
jgi:tRNA modification GTPase